MRGGPYVVDQSKIILADGSSFTNLSLLQATERLAPLVGSWGNQTEMSAFAAMAAAVTASDATIGTAAFKKAAGPRAMLLWGLEALRDHLHERGAKVFLPGTKAPAAATPASAEQQSPPAPAAAPQVSPEASA
ncbi:unnamed protein product [Pylaiella littoralis]